MEGRENKAVPDLAFVTKFYDSDLVGGGETLVREFSRRLVDSGCSVEILTTCIRDYHHWEDVYPPGLTMVENQPVRRFPVWQGGEALEHKQLGVRLGTRMVHTETDEYRWFHTGLHSPAMYQYLQRHGLDFRLTIILDYFVGLSLYALAANSGRTAVYPLLHKDPIAYTSAVRGWLNTADGIMFNGIPEQEFARFELGVSNPNSMIVGVGVETGLVGQEDQFRHRFGIDQPFLLYVGRLDVAKNLATLISYFQRYRSQHSTDLKLVLVGEGPFEVPDHGDILPLGFCSEEDKLGAYAAALALCQPSLLESLSIVTLEALAQGTPILAHGANDVTRYHCLAGNCGLYFYGYADFALTVDYLQTHPDARQQLGRNGRDYVEANYTWDKVMQRLLAAVERFGS